MINPLLIRSEPEKVKAGLESRNADSGQLDDLIAVDSEWRQCQADLDQFKHQRNQLAPKGKPTAEQLAALKKMSDEVKIKQEKLQELETKVKDLSLTLPNIPDPSVPVGKTEDDNKEVRIVGEIPTFDFEPKSHEDIAIPLGLLDFEAGASLAGSRFTVAKGSVAKLERVLTSFMLDKHTSDNGYTEILPPVMVNSDSMRGTGQLPKFAEDSFKIEDTDLWLSPTAEVQLTNLFKNKIIPESELPLKITAGTNCFRKEAGTYGKDISGIIRQHQFTKVELVKLVTPEQSSDELERLLNDAESILKALKLPYRVVSLCTGDLGFSSAKTYDLEVWFPSQKRYREISSCSNFLDFQSRRAMIRYKQTESGKVSYLHTLNGSGLAVGRTLAAILENYQCKNGTVTVPEILKPVFGMDYIT